MKSEPLISVCIPTYNHELLIARTIQSVLDQTYQNIEIIISDDCSSDNTIHIINSFTDERIKLHSQSTRLGLEKNWNTVVSYATGEYVKLLCGDDVLYADCLKKQLAVFNDNPELDIALVISKRDIIDVNDHLITNRFGWMKNGLNTGNAIIKKTAFIGTNILGEPLTGLYRRIDLIRYDGQNPYLIDLDFWVKLISNRKLFYINESLGAFRVSKTSLSSNIKFNQAGYFISFIYNLLKRNKIALYHFIPGVINAFLLNLLRNFIILLNTRHKN